MGMQQALSGGTTLEDQIRARWGQFGDWRSADQDQVAALAQAFRANGITDLSKFELKGREYQIPPNTWETEAGTLSDSGKSGTAFDAYYDGKQVGYLGDINRDGSWQAQPQGHVAGNEALGLLRGDGNLLAWSAQGGGNTGFMVVQGPNGPVVVPTWGSSSSETYGDIRGVASIAALAAGGYYAPAEGLTGAMANGGLTGYSSGVAGDILTNPDGGVDGLVSSSLRGAFTGAAAAGANYLYTNGLSAGPSSTAAPRMQTVAQDPSLVQLGDDALQVQSPGLTADDLRGSGWTTEGLPTVQLDGGSLSIDPQNITADTLRGSGWQNGTGATPTDSATRAVLNSAEGYGPGMTGDQTGIYDRVLNATGSPGLANVAAENPTVATVLNTGADLISGGQNGQGGGMNWIDLVNLGTGIVGAVLADGNADSAREAASNVAQGQLNLSNEALDWFKQVYAEQAPDREAARARADAVSNAQVRLMTTAADQADELYNYNKTTFRPVEERLVREAMAYDTPERRMSAAASAAADIDTSAAAARQASDRALARSGIAPGSTKALALAEDSTVRQAVARGSAQTNAVRQVEQQGHARMADAAALGRGIATQQATQQQIATTAGSGAVSASNAGLTATQSGNATMGQGFQTAMTGLNAAGNLFSSVANTQTAQNGQLLNGIGQIGQFAGSYLSDKTKKKGTGRMANAAESLKQVEATPVHEGWQYDPAKGGPDDGGKTHTGPMAQDVQRTMGEAAAPGGKAIDVATVTGRMMSAIQELSRRVKKLEHEDITEAA